MFFKTLVMILSFASIFFDLSSAFLTYNQAKLAAALAQFLGVRQVAFITDCSKVGVISPKTFSDNKLLFNCFNDHPEFMTNFENGHVRTILIPEENSVTLQVVNYAIRMEFMEYMCKNVWLLFSGNEKKLSDLQLRYDCEFYIAISVGENFDIYESYMVGDKRFQRKVGFNNPAEGLLMPDTGYVSRRLDLQGYQLKIKRAQVSVGQEELTLAQRDVVMGYVIIMNTTYVDVGDDYDVSEVAMVVIDYSATWIGPTTSIVLNMHIKYSSQSLDQYYIRPFAADVWASILINIVIGAAGVFIIFIFSVKVKTWTELYGPILLPFDSYCNQDGSGVFADKWSVRILKLSVRVVSAVIYPAYSATIISFLTVQLPFIPFTNLNEFVALGTYTLLGVKNTIQVAYFSSSPDPSVQLALKYIPPNDEHPSNIRELTNKMCDTPNIAIIGYNAFIPNMWTPCRALRISTPVTKYFIGFHHGLGLPFGPIYKKLLNYYRSNGILNRRQHLLDRIKAYQEIELDPVEISVPIERVWEIIAIVPFGLALSIILFLIESAVVITRKCCKKVKKKGTLEQRRIMFRSNNIAYNKIKKLNKKKFSCFSISMFNKNI